MLQNARLMRSVPRARIVALCLWVVAAIITQTAAQAQSTLIPLTTRRDMVFDHSGRYLYITTSDGWVRPYNLLTRQLEPGHNLGGWLNGADISPDDSFLLVAQKNVAAQGTIHKLNLLTGAITNINYSLYDADGAWDIAIGSHGRALFTTNYPGTGWTPLREIDLATNTVIRRTDAPTSGFSGVSNRTQIHRSVDANRFYIAEGNSPGNFIYDAVTNAFGPVAYPRTFHIPASIAINRNGSLLVTRRDTYATLDQSSDLSFQHSFSGLDSGVAFDAVSDLLYVVNTTTDQIIAYDTNTYVERLRFPIGENISPNDPYNFTSGQFDTGMLVASQDGRYLALGTPSGFRVISVPAETGPPPMPIFGKPRDMVFARFRPYLYITTATGFVWPFNLSTNTLEAPYNIGGSLNGVDIAADDSFLLIAENNIGLGRGIVHKLDLDTRAVTHITYPIDRWAYDNGIWDVAIGVNGIAMMTTSFGGPGSSGWAPLLQIDLATNAVTTRPDAPGSGSAGVEGSTMIDRSADRTRFLFLEPNNSSGPIFTYSVTTNTFGPPFQNFNFNELLNHAISRDGSAMILRYHADSVMDTLPDFGFIHRWTGIFDSGVAFDAVDDILYAVRSASDQIIAFDTNTFGERFRVAIGEDVAPTPREPETPAEPFGNSHFSTGLLVASQDGRHLALIAPTSVRVMDLVAGTSIPLLTLPRLGNISTRAFVGTGDTAPIAGFIITGAESKRVAIRAMGPSLAAAGVAGALQDPTLALHIDTGAVVAVNDNWRDVQQTEIELAGLAPNDDREAAIIMTLSPGSYTAVVRGSNDTTGVGLVEVYDLDANANSQLANISTRGIVGSGDNVMIAGVIVSSRGGNVGGPAKFLMRGLGPSLTQFNVPNAIPDPTLSLYDSNGSIMAYNQNWGETQRTEIQNSGLAPVNDRESAIVANLPPGNYTVILREWNFTTGVGLVEVYALQ